VFELGSWHHPQLVYNMKSQQLLSTPISRSIYSVKQSVSYSNRVFSYSNTVVIFNKASMLQQKIIQNLDSIQNEYNYSMVRVELNSQKHYNTGR